MIRHCCDLRRREATRQSTLNGIDFLEVIDNAAPVEADRQRFLHVHLLKDPAPTVYDETNLVVEGPGGELPIVAVQTGLAPQLNVVVVELLAPGDFAIHRLRFRRGLLDERPPVELDPQLAAIDFSFKVECPSDFDCLQPCGCADPPRPLPEIDYLARDTASFRRLMIGRLATVQPDAPPPHVADLRMALVDGLAVMADQIAQLQDAAHTDAWLAHVRSRVSARRLGLAVDYALDEGRNARCFVHLAVDADLLPVGPDFAPVIPAGTAFASRIGDEGAVLSGAAALDRADVVFEALMPLAELRAAHTEMAFHSWSDQACCLRAGATSATLAGHFPDLAPGHFLAFEEVLGPRTGNPADRDRANRPVVRLDEVSAFDGGAPRTDPVTGAQVTEIRWVREDALVRPLCLSAETDAAYGRVYLPRVSVARGNIVLADHGRTISDEPLGSVPEPVRAWAPGRGPLELADAGARPRNCTETICDRPEAEAIIPRFAPVLAAAPLTFAAPLDPLAGAVALLAAPGLPQPSIDLVGTLDGGARDYFAQRNLLGSGPDTPDFVPEVEADGRATLRFGDDVNGLRPNARTAFVATYRVGLGPLGNIGEDRLVHMLGPAGITEVRNMTAAVGGRAPESVAAMRRRAPFAYRRQDRAVTRDDHDVIAARFRPPEGPLQGSVTDIMHTGSWHTVKITADRTGGLAVDPEFRDALRAFVEPYRMAGRDLEVDQPIAVPLEIDLQVCVSERYQRGQVKAALLEVFSNRVLPDGTLGAFHPDRMRFGATVHLSPLIALAQGVAGVVEVKASLFRRFNDPDSSGLAASKLLFGRREIARLDNDPSHPDRGVLRLAMRGGR
ncbi:hypothetical protein [Sphingomonas sp.]|uniref:hypothetical protein n=1 Tax=Sphingomonas sp. TaxID=28214 RepID=UPI0031DEE680